MEEDSIFDMTYPREGKRIIMSRLVGGWGLTQTSWWEYGEVVKAEYRLVRPNQIDAEVERLMALPVPW